jgi:hypothetical protein
VQPQPGHPQAFAVPVNAVRADSAISMQGVPAQGVPVDAAQATQYPVLHAVPANAAQATQYPVAYPQPGGQGANANPVLMAQPLYGRQLPQAGVQADDAKKANMGWAMYVGGWLCFACVFFTKIQVLVFCAFGLWLAPCCVYRSIPQNQRESYPRTKTPANCGLGTCACCVFLSLATGVIRNDPEFRRIICEKLTPEERNTPQMRDYCDIDMKATYMTNMVKATVTRLRRRSSIVV